MLLMGSNLSVLCVEKAPARRLEPSTKGEIRPHRHFPQSVSKGTRSRDCRHPSIYSSTAMGVLSDVDKSSPQQLQVAPPKPVDARATTGYGIIQVVETSHTGHTSHTQQTKERLREKCGNNPPTRTHTGIRAKASFCAPPRPLAERSTGK